ncbi:MAG: DNA mismatch repair protein MutS, partial [Desulfovibrio sp.]|nr:DNA mismatch repair protein MutS [Desulfovibrio sp.]
VQQGFHAGLDALLDLVENGEQNLQRLLAEEQQRTGLGKLKLGYNRVFGYFYEIPRAGSSGPPPEHFIRRQTLVNAERFTTEALKTLEEELLSAADKRKSLEYQMFQDLRAHVAAQRERLVQMADLLAHLDYWQCLAEVGRRNGWRRPALTEGTELAIRQGRHPVVEAMVGSANFVPNDIRLDKEHHLCLLTGPNMAGKSTVLRQVALICLLAQMGSMVPAEEAVIGLVDRLFSRVGASDDLARGQSTFMVEMMETARILRQATRRSLVILDEIGRGTSTFDGMALAWAVAEDLAGRGAGELRTLFATHYHELTALEGRIPGVFTMNIAIREHNNDILFLHKLVPGPSDRSYGVEVARLAGVPVPVVQRARGILAALEQSRESGRKNLVAASLLLPGLDVSPTGARPPETETPSRAPHIPHPLLGELERLEPEELSPLAALKLLMEWKARWGAPGQDTEGGEGA